jgi:hypothetical protein
MRIVVCSRNKNVKEKKKELYEKYAFLVFNSLKRPRFQKFLKWIFKIEDIEKSKIKDIQIRTFPVLKENGKQLLGKCNANGEIFLYPKKFDKCNKKIKILGKFKFGLYIKKRAKITLIHELLHLKYENNEPKVKALTKKYYEIYSNYNI